MSSEAKRRLSKERVTLLETVSAPLGFFVLSLLIVESFIVTFALAGKVEHASHAIWLGAGLFVFVVAVVATFVWFKPEHLIFTRDNHLARLNARFTEVFQANRQLQEAIRDGMFFRSHKRYSEAIASFERATLIDPDSDEALVHLAVAKNLADPASITEPLSILNRVIARSPDYERALYNRACIKCASNGGFSKGDWLSDLRKAIEVRPMYREYAIRDVDFAAYRNDAEFLAALDSK